MLKFLNVTTPPTAFTGLVPESAAPLGLAWMVILTEPVNVVARLPPPSTACTTIGGDSCAPTRLDVGWPTNTSRTGRPATTVMVGSVDVTGAPPIVALIVVGVPARMPVKVA